MKKTKELLRKITKESLNLAAQEMGISEDEFKTDALDIEHEIHDRGKDGFTDLIVEIIDTTVENPGFSHCYKVENNDYSGFVINFNQYPENHLVIQIDYPENIEDLINQILEKIEKYKADDVIFDNIYLYNQEVISLERILGRPVTDEEVKMVREKFYCGGLIGDAIKDLLTRDEKSESVGYFMSIYDRWVKKSNNYKYFFEFPIHTNTHPFRVFIATDENRESIENLYKEAEAEGKGFVMEFFEFLESKGIRFSVVDMDVINVFNN